MVNAHAAMQQLLQLRANALRPIEPVHLVDQLRALRLGNQVAALQLLGDVPALLTVEAEDQGRSAADVGFAFGHERQLFIEQLIADPAVAQRHAALGPFDQLQLAAVRLVEPAQELAGVAHRGRQEQQSHMRGQHGQRQFPNDPALHVGEAVKLVHYHGRDVREIEGARLQQPIEQNLGHDDQHLGARVHTAIARYQADVFGLKAPAHRGGLHFGELLIRECDKRRGVIGHLAGVQGLEQRSLGDQRLAGARRRTDQHALLGSEPGQDGIFLHSIRRKRQLRQISLGKIVA